MRQTVSQTAEMLGLPIARQNHNWGYSPSVDRGGKKATIDSVLILRVDWKNIRKCGKILSRHSQERLLARGRLLARQLKCWGWLSRDKTRTGGIRLHWTGGGERYCRYCRQRVKTKAH